MDRRTLLRATVLGAGAVALPFTGWSAAYAAAREDTGPYGPLGAADANGISLPAGFTSSVVARSGRTVANTGYRWHDAPDGGATFPDGDGWIYVSNSEVPLPAGRGGASMLTFDAAGRVVGARRILSGTTSNCAGGGTPWNTWLSCEEIDRGRVFETYPRGGRAAVARPAMGRFKHEAAAADPARRVVYLTEDEPDGRFYRFVPARWPNLSAGTLQVLCGGTGTSGAFTWARVPDPDGLPVRTRHQVPAAKRFNGGEGCYYADDTVWFTTKGDNRIWEVDLKAGRYRLAYDDNLIKPGPAPLTGVDNLTGSSYGDLYVAEDNGNMEICMITPAARVSRFLRVNGHDRSELTGVAFNPKGDRFYFSSQRGGSGLITDGITYCVQGPFRT
ncbi:alkaline phosphatase PhoX [Actinoplanes sp. NPDC049118]|uniref:alkaline phosphatase PhoX n=1 Tax=Actinoplanes sp. NPDC049118 TaxID=3155769 RepID=UPI0033F2BB4A